MDKYILVKIGAGQEQMGGHCEKCDVLATELIL
jgi:hypothetical protein